MGVEFKLRARKTLSTEKHNLHQTSQLGPRPLDAFEATFPMTTNNSPTSSSTSPKIRVAPSTQGLDYWRTRTEMPADLMLRIKQASVLIVPWENFRTPGQTGFPAGTDELLEHIAATPRHAVSAEIFATDETYHEIALHSDFVHLATMAFEAAMWPILCGIISNYIYAKLGRNSSTGTVRFSAHITGHKKTINVEYEGPADTFQKSISEIIQKEELTPAVPSLPNPTNQNES